MDRKNCARISDVLHHIFEQAFAAKAVAEKAAAEKAAAAAAKVAAQKAAAEKAAAEERRGNAAPIRAWLSKTCQIDNDKELTEILDLFVDQRYGVSSLKRLFALQETDVDTILRQATISVSTHRLVKQTWREKVAAEKAAAEKPAVVTAAQKVLQQKVLVSSLSRFFRFTS